MSTPDPRTELSELLQRLSAGELSAQESGRLNELLHGDPSACEQYLEHVTLEAHLHNEFGGQKPEGEGLPPFLRQAEPPAGPAAGPATLLSRRMLGLAAALMLGGMLGWLSGQGRHEPPPLAVPDGTPSCVATLLFADDCEWSTHEHVVEGQRLCIGTLRLDRGLALLRFDGGAAVVLQGPSEFELESPGAARLHSGRLTVRAPAVAAGFTVRTPASDVVDLGTEFAVVVEQGGATELHVLEGEVTYGKHGLPRENAELLVAGEAVRFDQARRESPRTVPLKAARFAELLSQAKIGPRDDLLLVHEGFNYPVGPVPLAEANGGLGWAGPWRHSPRSKPNPLDPDGLTIGFAELQVPWPVQGGRGPMLAAPDDYRSRIRTLAQPVRLDQDGVYYVSMLTRWQAPPPDTHSSPLPAVRIVLRSEEHFNGDHVMFNLPITQRPQIDIRTGATFTSPQTMRRDGTQFWVGKIVARAHGEDEVFLRVYQQDEALDPIEPADWTVRSRGVRSDAKLDLVLLTKFGPGKCWWDEVRIGKSWRAVVPQQQAAKP